MTRIDRIHIPPDVNGPRHPVRSTTPGNPPQPLRRPYTNVSFLRSNVGLIEDEKKPTPSMYELFRPTSLPAGKDSHPAPPVGSGSKHGAGTVSRHQPEQRGGRPQKKNGKALWGVVAATVRFISFAKRPSAGGRGGG